MLDSRHVSLRSCALAVSVPLFLAASSARAQQPTEVSESHEHEGLFLHALLGPSFILATTTAEGEDLSASGGGATLRLAAGWNVASGLVVFAEAFADVTVSPTFEVGDLMEEPDDTSFGVSGVGAGLAYYLGPNYYVSGSIDVVSLRLEYQEGGRTVARESDEGIGGNITLGREFWVSDGWALGLAVQAFLGSVPGGDGDDDWTVGTFGAGLSATFD
jgi:hypothetical protein